MSNNKDIETNTNENTQKSETPKKKNIVHVIRPQNAQNGGNKGRRPFRSTECVCIRSTGSKEDREAGSRKNTEQTSGKK